ncbi:MAG: hypothetical protein ASARMPREDX12_000755 [Alectoria sarmentosa]|nr:MAG: hypothetical protein ASARMPREDX12_000755 [Alectoria sarmentosa]
MVSDGYTFTSPSVYVIYTGMQADEYCDSGLWSYDSYTNGSYINGSWSKVSRFWSQVGSIHTRVTRAYAPEALSTGGDCYGTSWAAINYTRLYSPQPDYEVITEAACSRQSYRVSKGQTIDSSYFLAGDALLSMPSDLSLIDPLSSTCPTNAPDSPTQAKPASSPIHSLPVQTPSSALNTPAEGQPFADGSRSDPSNASADQKSKIGEALAPTAESKTGSDPGNQGHVDAPVAAIPQQGAGHETLPTSNPHQESDAQGVDFPQIPDPAGQGQQSAPVVTDAQQNGGSDSPNMISHQESGIQAQGSPAVDTTKTDDPWGTSMMVGTHTILVDVTGTSFDGAPLDLEGSPVTVSGTAAMIQGSSIIIGDAIVHLPSPAAVTGNPTLIAGYMVTPLAGAVAIDGEILHAGESPRTIAGTLMSLDSNDNLALNPTIQTLPTPPPAAGILVDGQTISIDGLTFKVLPNGVYVAETTLTPGGPAATVSGAPISLDTTALMIDTRRPRPETIDNEPITLNKAGSLILGTRTLALDGTRLTTRIGDELITAAPTGVQIAGSTLLPGATGWTIDGTRVSLDTMGDVMIGTKTIALGGQGADVMGGLILAGFGPKRVAAIASSSPSGASGSIGGAGVEGEVFEGRAERLDARGFWIAAAVAVGMVFV